MAFTQNFSIAQGVDVTSFTLTDTSTGSDPAIVSRHVFLTKADGTYLVPNGTTTSYIDFPLSQNNTLNLVGILQVDYCLNIVVNWVDTNGNTLYTKNGIYLFTGNSELFYYGLTQQQSANPNIVRDNYFYSNKLQLRVEIDSANQALNYSNQIAAQQCLDRAKYMITNQNDFF